MNRSFKTLLMLAVGYITFFGAVLISVSSEAAEIRQLPVAQEVGTFVPSVCGQPVQVENQPVVSEVCIGEITGDLAKNSKGAYAFKDERGRAAVYRVTDVSNMYVKLMSGAVRTQVFLVGPNGDEISMKVKRKNGQYVEASGRIGDAEILVPNFQPATVTL